MVLSDRDPKKWALGQHTAAKHAVLARYMKAWLPILAYSARARKRPAELVIVDGFAGRGTYSKGEPGSPLILRRIARDVVSTRVADEIELFFVEKDPDNHAELQRVLAAEPAIPGIVPHPPERSDFATAARRILGPDHLGVRPRPAFWFVDPFGFSGMPLSLIREILRPPRSEVFITFMAREANRFLESPQHAPAAGADAAQAETCPDPTVSPPVSLRSSPRRAARHHVLTNATFSGSQSRDWSEPGFPVLRPAAHALACDLSHWLRNGTSVARGLAG